MDRMGLEEGEVIQHSMITRSIERAQKKVEENNFGTRKRLLEYDDVMNSQREVIYTKRRHALFGERLSIDIANMIFDTAEGIVNEYHAQKDYEGFRLELIKIFSLDLHLDQAEFNRESSDEITNLVFQEAWKKYEEKSLAIAERTFPVIRDVYENKSATYENILVPFTDGQKTIQIAANLKRAFESKGKDIVTSFEKSIILAFIDDDWKEHLRDMDDLKQSVQGAVYEQKDPLLIYKFESFELFKTMLGKMNKEIVAFLFKGGLPDQSNASNVQQATTQRPSMNNLKAGRADHPSAPQQGGAQQQEQPKAQPVRVEEKIGRNDPCPCGSGKKYKACHGK
jgi:preprotein translocase subunit SecA